LPKEEPAAIAHDADLGAKVVDYAKNFLGVKYVYGGTTPEGFDCSGFVKYVYDHFNISIERVSTAQATQGAKISRSELEPGDLVFFDTNGGHNAVNHAGIYIGDGQFIQASSGQTKVVISNLNSGFYDESFMTARRFF
jgi:N-acetylmuramoyl-L-alanine amidase